MNIDLDYLQRLMEGKEDENLEFKEAKTSYEFDNLVKYCAALANEGGGWFVLGVTDKIPRKVVGSQAFIDLEQIKPKILDRLHLRIDADEVIHPHGRVLVFTVPGRPIGVPIQDNGRYWMRSGESLVPMTQDLLKRIFEEAGPDFSAEICPKASVTDLDLAAIDVFRQMWVRKSRNKALLAVSNEQLLVDAELIVDEGITYAGLILFGTRTALGKHLPQSEVIFEYRSSEASVAAQQRKEYREGLFLFHDDLWNTINLRNDIQQFREGLFVWDIATFNEDVVREAILNAVTHRDYRLHGSIFVRQFPRRLEVVSPGGFLPGITPANALWRQAPRNRRIAENCAKCGLIERSGQGIDKMFRESIKESKPSPDFTGTDDYQVFLTLRGEVQDPIFLRFLERVGVEKLAVFSTEDFLVLDNLHREQPVDDQLKPRLPNLVKEGIVERIGSGKGVRYILSRQFYHHIGERGVYTRQRGLDRETNKELLLKHIRSCGDEGCQHKELRQVLPSLSRDQVQKLLGELKVEERIHNIGATSATRWYLSPTEAAREKAKGRDS